MLIRWFLQL